MENLTNEQIIDIINFYNQCGIAEEIYLSKDGALDLFTLLKIKPEFDDEGNRILTPYELLEVVPKFRGREEVPIVFAIKHKVSKVAHGLSGEFAYGGEKKQDSMEILHKFKKDYFNAMAVGNLSEAQRTFDLIDKLTGGNAEEIIGVNYNYEMFYAKMKRQLLIDLFVNFLILRIMNRKSQVKEGIVKVDKLYKEFVESQTKQESIVADIAGFQIGTPVIENIELELDEDELENEEDTKKTTVSVEKFNENVAKQTQEAVVQKTITENVTSFIKERVEKKIKNVCSGIFDLFAEQNKESSEEEKSAEDKQPEKPVAVLESN